MKLKRELSLLDVFCIASGAMISSGLFILPGLAHAQAGPAAFIAYVIAALLAMTGMLSQAELVSAMPKAGGTYFYVSRSLGPVVGTVDGLITWFSLSLKSAFALVGMAAFAALVVDVNMQIVSVSFCVLFILINLFGVKEAGKVQVLLVLAMLAILLFYIIRGLPAVNVQRFEPFAPHGTGAIFVTAGFVFVSFGGLLKVASVAEEVKDPGRVVPLGMMLSLLVVGILYMLVVLVTSGVLPAEALHASLTPISDGAAAFMGGGGRIVLAVAAVLAFISTANAGILAASRYLLASSRDHLLPETLGRINAKFHTPHVAILVTGAFMIGALFLELDKLVKAASSVLIMTYMFSCLSVIILRESRLQNYRPRFRSPLYPLVQLVGIVGCGFLLFRIGRDALLVNGALIFSGIFVYWFYGRIRANREYALLHLIERITAEELTSHSLQTELKEIIRERDEIVKDRFDHIIEKSIVLDLAECVSAEGFFTLVAGKMAQRLKLDPDELLRLLQEREAESTTVLTPFLAIPHIVIESEGTFDILLARCRGGINFHESGSQVQAVFVLAGGRDERNFHLRALAAIAQIVQDPRFEKRWSSARSKEELRDIVLLGERRRHQ
jgi:amino acid transporter